MMAMKAVIFSALGRLQKVLKGIGRTIGYVKMKLIINLK